MTRSSLTWDFSPSGLLGCGTGTRVVSPSPRKDPLLAASRNASTANTNNGASTAPLRISFAKIKEPLEVPNLLALQTESFDWLLGNAAWKARVEAALDSGQDVPTKSGLEEIFEEISPIEDFSGSMSLTFRDHRFEPPKNSIDECKERDFTYARPALRHRRVHQQRDRRDQVPDGLHGRLPAHDQQGHLRHQRHRACRRVAAGPLAGCLLRLLHRQDVRQGHLLRQDHPVPGCLAGDGDRQARHGRCPHRPQAQAVRHRPAQGSRLDHRADPRGVRRVRVHARHPGEGPHPGPGRRAARHLPQAASGRAADP